MFTRGLTTWSKCASVCQAWTAASGRYV